MNNGVSDGIGCLLTSLGIAAIIWALFGMQIPGGARTECQPCNVEAK